MFPFIGSTEPPSQAKPPFSGLVELDDYLMGLSELPKDIAIQLSKSGSNTIGGPKLSLELGIGLNDYIYMSDSAKKEARARYGSYNPELRVNALSEVEANILVNYITPEGMQTLLSSQRSLRIAYQKSKSDTQQMRTPSSFLVDVRGKPTPGNPQYEVPLFAFEVFFEDQNGVRHEMPYEISCRGAFNFHEAYQLTNKGLNTAQMSLAREFRENGVTGTNSNQMNAVMGQHAIDFPKNHASGTMKSDSYYHLLYQWGDMLRGNVEIDVSIPQNIMNSDWSNERTLSYGRTFNRNMDIEMAGTQKATPTQNLFKASFTLDSNKPEVFEISIPIYIEPLPNHLVMTSDGIKSKWEVADDINNIADHQKVALHLRLARPRSNELWANADFDDDMAISYDEYISPEGVAARRAGRAGASPVPNTKIVFTPDPMNSWVSAKKTYMATSNISGFLNITLPPGRWTVNRTTNELASVSPEHQGSQPFEYLSLIEQGMVSEKYGADAPNLHYAPNSIPMAKISIPAAFYWRESDEYDTTPTAVVGAKLIQDLTGQNQDLLSSYELRSNFPPLQTGKPASADTIYQKLKGMYPQSTKAGYPQIGEGTTTSRQVFDTAVMMFKEDSPYDLSLVGEFERQLESEFDTTVQGTEIQMPGVGSTTEYNGYKIMRVIVDASTKNQATENQPPGMDWTEESQPFFYIDIDTSQISRGEYVEEYEGIEVVHNLRLPLLSGHRTDGKSFEALVYYKEHTAENTEIISLRDIEFGYMQKKRMTDNERLVPENSPIHMYGTSIPSLHMWSNVSAAILAGQFIPIKAPTHHAGWTQINEELSAKSEGQNMLEVLRAIDGGGEPKFPPGESYTTIHQKFKGQGPVWNLKAPSDLTLIDQINNPIDFSQLDISEGRTWPRDGSYYPGSLVFFESDVFPTAMVVFPAGYDVMANLSGTRYLGEAQAHVEFLQDIGPIQAPQPFADEDDEYNMGFGIL